VNEKSFRALTGRKLTLWSKHTTIVLLVSALILMVAMVATAFLSRHLGGTSAPAAAVFAPLFITFLFRTTLITVRNDSLDFYFIDNRLGSSYVVSDKLNLPYDRISKVKVKVGRVFKNTHVTFEFLHNDKKYKIKTSIPNKMKKMQEQEGNLKHLLEMLEKKCVPSL